MSEKHLPYIGGNFDRIVFEGDGSTWVREQESIVRSFLRKISPNRDWDYLGEHEHALIADLVDAIAATLGNPEIVRCRDCRAMRVKYGNTGIECWMNGEPFTVEPDGFCAWGERKDGGDD